jgi:hypothetical protein
MRVRAKRVCVRERGREGEKVCVCVCEITHCVLVLGKSTPLI